MGCKFSNNNLESTKESNGQDNQNSLSNYKFHMLIGKGGFSKVWRVEDKKTKTLFAMKIMPKLRIIEKNSVINIMNELKILSKTNHSFIIKIQSAFQDRENLYLVMDYYKGGDLRYYLARKTKFTEEQSKFIISCIILALEYLHYNSIIHRDIKPENLIIDERGYICLTDFGVANQTDHKIKDSSGTPSYMAPEVLNNQLHNATADYYSLGVILYEMIMQKRPFQAKSRNELKSEMITNEAKISSLLLPLGWSLNSVDFANKLLNKKSEERLGTNGFMELKNHIWLKDVDWKKLYKKEIKSPFRPDSKEKFNLNSINKKEILSEDQKFLLDMINQADYFSDYSLIKYTNHIEKIFHNIFINPHDENFKSNLKSTLRNNDKSLFMVDLNHMNKFDKSINDNSFLINKNNFDTSKRISQIHSEDLNNFNNLSKLSLLSKNNYSVINFNQDSTDYIQIKRNKNKNILLELENDMKSNSVI